MINGFPFSLSRFVAKRGDSQSDESSSGHNTNNDAESQSNWRAKDHTPITSSNNGNNQAPWRSKRVSQIKANSYTSSDTQPPTKYNDTLLEWRKPTTGNTEDTERRIPFSGLDRRKYGQDASNRFGSWDRSNESTSLQTRRNSNGLNEGNQKYDDFLL
jgi:hypothetical protein